jgi:hypothetical protein
MRAAAGALEAGAPSLNYQVHHVLRGLAGFEN